MKWFLGLMTMGLLAAAPAAYAAGSGDINPFDSKFDSRWMECTGECCTPDEDGICVPNPLGCKTILNECSYPIQVKCGVAVEAAKYFSTLRKQVKCRGEVDEKTAPRAPNEWIH